MQSQNQSDGSLGEPSHQSNHRVAPSPAAIYLKRIAHDVSVIKWLLIIGIGLVTAWFLIEVAMGILR